MRTLNTIAFLIIIITSIGFSKTITVNNLSEEVSSLEAENQGLVEKVEVADEQLNVTKKQLENEKTKPISISDGNKFDFIPIKLPDSDDN